METLPRADPVPVLVGTQEVMDRTELLHLVSTASTLNQISSVMAAVRAWLADHPDDAEMREAVATLSRVERGHFGLT